MAGTAKKVVVTGMPHSDLRNLVVEHNKLIDDLEAIRAALCAHTHTENSSVTYTQNATTGAPTAATIAAVDTAAELLAAKLTDRNGTTIEAS